MPKKHPNTVRWGGPGASHEDRTKPVPPPAPGQPLGAASTNPRVSQVSGGGGERDEKHSHADPLRSSKSHATDSASPTSSPDWRRNRSRRDREREEEVREALGEPRSFETGGGRHHDAGTPEAPDAGDAVPVRVTFEGESEAVAGPVLADEAERTVRRAIARCERHLSEIDIYLSDAAPHGSPGLKSCMIQAMPHRGELIAVTSANRDIVAAMTRAAVELSRRLDEAYPRPAPEASPGGPEAGPA